MSRYWLFVALLAATLLAADGRLVPRDVSGVPRGTPQWYMTGAGLASTDYSEVEADLYRYGIKPETPETGITTGWVIAYGHLLARPYQFTIKQETLLFVNGVQVEPALKNPAYWRAFDLEYARVESLGKLHPDTTWGALRGAFKRTFQRLVAARVDSATIVESLVALVKSSPGVRATPPPTVSVRPGLTSALLRVFYVGRNFRLSSECYSEDRPSVSAFPPETPEERRRIKSETMRSSIRSDSLCLLGGGTRMYGYWAGGKYSEDYPKRIWAVLSADSIGWQAKFASIQARLGPSQRVKEAIYNFDRDEYDAVLKAEKR